MRSIAAIACLLLAASQLCVARQVPAVSERVIGGDVFCAEELFDGVKDTALFYLEQYGEQLHQLLDQYRECQSLPEGGDREECLLFFGRTVVQLAQNLRPQLEDQWDNVLRYALSLLDGYYVCRNMRSTALTVRNDEPTYCAIKLYTATRQAVIPYFNEHVLPRLEVGREAFLGCYNGAAEEQATCYYNLFVVVRAEVLEAVQQVNGSRDALVQHAVRLLDNYYTCRLGDNVADVFAL